MTYNLISLSNRFPPGTIGHDIIYNPVSAQNANFLLTKIDLEYKPISKRRIGKKEEVILDIFSETESPDLNKFLEEIGYDPNDPRICINRKKT